MNNVMKKILVVEDEQDIRELIKIYLESHNFEVLLAEDGYKALNIFHSKQPDLVVLDILLPGINGGEVCKNIRQQSDVPVLFLSCKNDADDILSGFELGVDDYITKPFDPSILVARIKAILRRTNSIQQNSGEDNSLLKFDYLEVDLTSYEVKVDGQPIYLFTKELQLLIMLVKNPNQVFSVEQLYSQIWGADSLGDTRTVMVHISNLRKKIERDPTQPNFIQTVRGFGYKFLSGNVG